VPHLGHAPIDWEVEGPRYRDKILAHLERTLIPGLREDLGPRAGSGRRTSATS
jgi:phytoene desaturase